MSHRGIWMDLNVFEHSLLVDCLVRSRLPQFICVSNLKNDEHRRGGRIFSGKTLFFFSFECTVLYLSRDSCHDLDQVLLERAYGAFLSTISLLNPTNDEWRKLSDLMLLLKSE